MYKLAWNISFEKKINFSFDNIFFIETENLDWTYNYFFYGKTYKKTELDILTELEKIAWEWAINKDISISIEDELEVYFDKQVNWSYTLLSIEGKEENFKSVLEKFKNSSPHIVSIREAENSKVFWNRIIKIDIIN